MEVPRDGQVSCTPGLRNTSISSPQQHPRSHTLRPARDMGLPCNETGCQLYPLMPIVP